MTVTKIISSTKWIFDYIFNSKYFVPIKEALGIGVDYPLYMYSSIGNVYLSKAVSKGDYIDVIITHNIDKAQNFRKLNMIQRWLFLRKINSRTSGLYLFRYKGVVNLEVKMDMPMF